jgi:hypothetical protein
MSASIRLNSRFQREPLETSGNARRAARVRSVFVLLIFALLASQGHSDARTDTFLWGVGTHAMSVRNIQGKVMESLARGGFNTVRDEAPWKFVETSKGTYQIPPAWDAFVDAAVAESINPILILDYGNSFYDGGDKPRSSAAISGFVRYAEFVVKHFAGRVKYYEVWNEWDNTTGGYAAASPSDYARLFEATYPALKQADPSAHILLGSGIQKPQFYEELARLGTLAKADGVSIHPYNYDPILGPEYTADFLMGLEKELTAISGRSSIDFYVTEIGWPTHTGHGAYSESRVAEYAYRTTLLMSALPFVKGIWWYDLKDDGTDPGDKQDHFGLLHFDWTPKPAWQAMTEAVSLSKSNILSLSNQSILMRGRVEVEAKALDGSNAAIIWNLRNASPPIYAHCIPGKGFEISSSQSGSGGAAIVNPTLVELQRATCAAHPLPPTTIVVE